MAELIRITECLQSLALSDEQYGTARAKVKALEYHLKVCKNQGILASDHKTGVLKEAEAYTTRDYTDLVEAYENACIDAEILGAKRKTWELTIAVWQSQNANKRAGNII